MEEVHSGWSRRGLTSELDDDTLLLEMTRTILCLIRFDEPIDFLYTEHFRGSGRGTVNVLRQDMNEGGGFADVSSFFRAVIREPVQQETRKVLDTIISPEMSLKRETIDQLIEDMPQTVDLPPPRFDALESEVKSASFAGELSPSPCKPEGELTGDRSLRRVVGDRGGICRTPHSGGGDRSSNHPHVHETCAIGVVHSSLSNIDIAPPPAHAVGSELLQRTPRAVDIPPLRFDAQQRKVTAASLAGGLSPSLCKPESGKSWDRPLQGIGSDRGGTCPALCGVGGDRLCDDRNIHECPAPRTIFNKVGIG